MNTLRSRQPKLFLLTITLFVILTTLACQFGGSLIKQVSPTVAGQSQSSETESTKVSGEEATTAPKEGGFDLTDLTAGLDSLQSYHQKLSKTVEGTFKGNAYKLTETVERDVSGENSASIVHTTVNGSVTFLSSTRLENYLYTQTKENQPCQTAEISSAGGKEVQNPMKSLPHVTGVEVGPGKTQGSTKYQVQGGKSSATTGTFEISTENQEVLEYNVASNVKDGDFKGKMTWVYQLSKINEIDSITLPTSCQQVLVDFPTYPDAQNIIHRPGMIRYTVATNTQAVKDFYLAAMADQNWQALPGTAPAPAGYEDTPPASDITVLTFARPGTNGGGEVAVIQVAGTNDQQTVVIQITRTKKPVSLTPAPETLPKPGSGEESTPEASSTAEGQLALPDDLPAYPDANIMMQDKQTLVFETADPLKKVMDFYNTGLQNLGWEKSQESTVQNTTTTMWVKDKIMLILTLIDQGNKTQVAIVAANTP